MNFATSTKSVTYSFCYEYRQLTDMIWLFTGWLSFLTATKLEWFSIELL